MQLFSLSLRQRFYASLFLSALAVAVALYFQFAQGIEPCPLCVFQRIAMMLVALFSLFGLFLAARYYGALICSLCNVIAALGGLFYANKQVMLQYFPNGQSMACPIELKQFVEGHPWLTFLHRLFVGTADCAEHHWQFLGLSMAVYSALLLAVLLLLSLWQVWGVMQKRAQDKNLSCNTMT